MNNIYVTKTFLPPIEEYEEYLKKIWHNNQLTNQGPLLQDFQEQVISHLGVKYFHFLANGTLALQLAIKALGINEGEIITTPFSYVATTSSILWEKCEPVFVDIEPDTFCIDPSKIEAAITPRTKAIMAVHVFGNPCDVDAIELIAKKHDLKVIYDGAHAFGVAYKGRSLLDYGDISTCSFHATKVFHTIEGGGIFTKDKALSDKVDIIKRFGHNYDDHIALGINAKASEFQAAMGLVNMKHLAHITAQRKRVFDQYDNEIGYKFNKPRIVKNTLSNYAYYPLLLNSEEELLDVIGRLNSNNIFPRRYFYPSLNKLKYLKNTQTCPISEDISRRIMCLPLYAGLDEKDVTRICEILNQ